MRVLVALSALFIFQPLGSVSAQSAAALAPAVATASKARQNKIDEIVHYNLLSTEAGKRAFREHLQAMATSSIVQAGQKANCGSKWTPQHPLWQEFERSTQTALNKLANGMMQQTQRQLFAELANFSDAELDIVLHANRSPLSRKAEDGLLATLRLATLAVGADKNDSYLKAEADKQRQLLMEIASDPEFGAYMRSFAGQKMVAVSVKALNEQLSKMTVHMEMIETDLDLRLAIHQGKPSAELLPLHNALLFSAAAAGDIELMKAQLAQGADLRARDKRPYTRNETLLHVAARQADTVLLKFLLSQNLRDLIEVSVDAGQTPLQIAASQGKLAHVQVLLQHGAEINSTTALHVAAQRLDRPMVELLLAHGANVNALSASAGGTPLHSLGRYYPGLNQNPSDRLALVKLFLDSGADLLLENDIKQSAYSRLAGSNEDVSLMLLDQIPVAKRSALSEPPLMTATRSTHLKVMKRLLAEGADPNATDRAGWTPLLTVGYLRQPSANQATAIAMLLKHGANPLQRDGKGLGLLDKAAQMGGPGFEAQADALVALGLRADTAGPDGRTPLHRAVSEANVKKLISLSAAVDAQDNNGNTPLHDAVRRSNKLVVQALLTAGASLTMKNAAGETPTMIAETIKAVTVRNEMIKLLTPKPGI
jgi:ankyrin repeat protein